MSREQLSQLLTDMADEVSPASLHQPAITQSRRITTVRTIVAGVAALTLLGSGAAGAAALYPTDSSDTPAASGDTPTSDGTKLDGTFLNATNGEAEGMESWVAGDDEGTPLALPEGGMYYHTGSVSPDGKRVVYYTEQSEIMVADLDGGEATKTIEVSFEHTCTAPMWAPDGERVFMDRGAKFGDQRFGFLDPKTSDFTPSEGQPPGCGAQVSNDNGEDVFYSIVDRENDPTVFRTTGDGSLTEEMDLGNAVGDTHIREITAVSPDNRFACFSTDTETDQSGPPLDRWGDCDVIVDLKTTEPIELDFDFDSEDSWSGGPSMMSITDHFLVRAYIGDEVMWQLYDVNGELVNELPAGEENRDPMPLRYIPNG